MPMESVRLAAAQQDGECEAARSVCLTCSRLTDAVAEARRWSAAREPSPRAPRRDLTQIDTLVDSHSYTESCTHLYHREAMFVSE